MKIKIFSDAGKALMSIAKKDKDHVFIHHSLKKDEVVANDVHTQANEWIVISKGSFKVRVGEKIEVVKLSGFETMVIYVPKGKEHAFKALSKISYLVLRDK